MRRYRALVEYDGTAYCGFQKQLADPTIQGEIERALSQVSGQTVVVTGAGRTDTGVHARGQVISFEVAWRHGCEALQRALNATLPADIAILQLDTVQPEFHPRYDARKRVYNYHIANEPVRSPLRRHYSWHVSRPLAVDQMNVAAASLVGVHDFATFGRPPQGINTIREVFTAVWRRETAELLVFEIAATAFLHRMVRRIVGSLKLVGDGTWLVETFLDAFQACDQDRCGILAPPQGLYLVHVDYDELKVKDSR
ncbi:MAG: tRNA pseudouridine(38-40) synthase TruA [Anaerolineales bacterium]|nr:tRNA pseudouridine(38-40) synthase TruA [Anaerolineales bacterium]